MFTRFKRKELQNALLRSPAVVLLGPRQVGKTTLALDVAQPDGAYLDLWLDPRRPDMIHKD